MMHGRALHGHEDRRANCTQKSAAGSTTCIIFFNRLLRAVTNHGERCFNVPHMAAAGGRGAIPWLFRRGAGEQCWPSRNIPREISTGAMIFRALPLFRLRNDRADDFVRFLENVPASRVQQSGTLPNRPDHLQNAASSPKTLGIMADHCIDWEVPGGADLHGEHLLDFSVGR